MRFPLDRRIRLSFLLSCGRWVQVDVKSYIINHSAASDAITGTSWTGAKAVNGAMLRLIRSDTIQAVTISHKGSWYWRGWR